MWILDWFKPKKNFIITASIRDELEISELCKDYDEGEKLEKDLKEFILKVTGFQDLQNSNFDGVVGMAFTKSYKLADTNPDNPLNALYELKIVGDKR